MTTYRTTALIMALLTINYCSSMDSSVRMLTIVSEPSYEIRSTAEVPSAGVSYDGQSSAFPNAASRLLQTVKSQPGANLALGRQLFDLINQFRVSRGVPALIWNSIVYQFAAAQDAYMLRTNSLGDDRANNLALGFSYSNENVATFTGGYDAIAAANFKTLFLNSQSVSNSLLNRDVNQGAASISYSAANRRYFATIIVVRDQKVTAPAPTPDPTPDPEPTPNPSGDKNVQGDNLKIAQDLLLAINAIRAQSNLPALNWNEAAYQEAKNLTASRALNTYAPDWNARSAGWLAYAELSATLNSNGVYLDNTIASQFSNYWGQAGQSRDFILNRNYDGAAASVYYSKSAQTYFVVLTLVRGNRYTADGDNNVQGINRQTSEQLFSLINQYRVQKNLPALAWNEVAYSQAADQATAQGKQNVLSTANSAIRAQQWPRGYSEVAGGFTNASDSAIAQLFLNSWSTNAGINAYITTTSRTQGAVAIYYVKETRSYFSTLILVSV